LGEKILAKEREFRAMPILKNLIKDIPGLKIVVEHVSDRRLVDLVKKAPPNVAATVTAHHLLYTYDDVYTETGAIKNPHLVCNPIMKSWLDRKVIRQTVFGGNKKFFFGSDSAPHPLAEKRFKIPPPAGIFNPFALLILAHIFEQFGVLDHLENFVSVFGARFYGLDLNDEKVMLKKETWLVPCQIGEFPLVPLWAGQELSWQVV
jgi:dihydroorotase